MTIRRIAAAAIAVGMFLPIDRALSQDLTIPQYSEGNTQISVSAGRQFMLVLEADRANGYGWQLAKPFNGMVVRLMSSRYWLPLPVTPGQPGVERWTFRGIQPGQTTVVLNYRRAWEKKPPAKTVTYTISVH